MKKKILVLNLFAMIFSIIISLICIIILSINMYYRFINGFDIFAGYIIFATIFIPIIGIPSGILNLIIFFKLKKLDFPKNKVKNFHKPNKIEQKIDKLEKQLAELKKDNTK